MRQKIIGGYIVDFYCAAAKLIIEVDGSQHHAPDNCVYDEVRTQALNDLNLDVIRINNADIDKDFEAVCLFISEQVTQYLNQPRNPRPPL